MTDIEKLLAESAVRALIARYSLLVDERKGDQLVEEVFSPEAVVMLNGRSHQGRAEIRRWFDRIAVNAPGKHVAGNTFITVEAPDKASAISDWMFLRRVGGGWEVPLAGRYDDVFERRAGTWFFSRRQITPAA